MEIRKVEPPDVHEEYAEVNVLGGVSNLIHMHKGNGWKIPITYSVLVPTQNRRGVHMSRLVSAIQRNSENERIEYSMKDICKDVNRTQPGCRIICEIQYSYQDQFIPITIKMREKGSIQYIFRRTGITACPCSKVMVGIGHMQRAELTLKMVSRKIQDFDNVAKKMGACFSTIPKAHLKREDEGEKIQEAQSKPKFAEDVVRECLTSFSIAISIEVRSFESIHIHDAIAYWSRREHDDR
jgi:GTP cyclohydrolase FolE2